jgi:hypothetical protein
MVVVVGVADEVDFVVVDEAAVIEVDSVAAEGVAVDIIPTIKKRRSRRQNWVLPVSKNDGWIDVT